MNRVHALASTHRLAAVLAGLIAVLLIGVGAYAAWPTASPVTIKVRTQGSPASTSAGSPTPSPAGGTLTLSDQANGTTITVHPGDEVQVMLASTYWIIGSPSNQTVLVPQGPEQTSRGTSCPPIPGTGCGTASRTFLAQAAGTSLLSADRAACGEARPCTGTQGSWQATVVVRAP
jgi:hypothetical protein